MEKRYLAYSLVLVTVFVVCADSIPSRGFKTDVVKHSLQIRRQGREETVQTKAGPADPQDPVTATGKKAQKSSAPPDVDECKQKHIQDICRRYGKQCFNTVGGYKCDCGQGFYSDRNTCKDKDECKAGIHNCSKKIYCKNTRGGFQCVCPNGHDRVNSYKGVDCVASDLTRWITPEYFLHDLKSGLLSRCAAAGAAGLIVLLLLILGMACCVRRCKRRAKEKELKRLVYAEQLMFAAGLVDPNEIFYGEGYHPGGDMYYPEAMGQPPQEMGYPPQEMGYPPQEMGYPPQDMGYPMGDMNYAQNNTGYAEGMGGAQGTYVTNNVPPSGPMPIEGEFVPHTYYEDDHGGSEDETN